MLSADVEPSPEPVKATRPINFGRVLVALFLFVALYAVYAMVTGFAKLRAGLEVFHWSAFAAACGLAFGNYILRFLKWEFYLAKLDIRGVKKVDSFLTFLSGFVLTVSPGKVGEVFKSLVLHDTYDVPMPKTAPIVVAERVTDLIALLVLAVVGVAAYGVQTTIVVAAGGVVGMGLVLLAWPRPTRALIELVTRPRVTERFRDPLHQVYDGLVGLCRPSRLVLATAIAIPAWGLECIGFALIVNGFPGAHVDFGLAMMIYAATTIAGALSFLPGGLGVTEGAMTILLVKSAHGVDQPTALDATLLTRLATLWFAVVLGLVLLGVARSRIARRGRAQAA